jgi:NAD(P)-dependent dehydrogenase (short-subunit alcohol dehydrogenase family)
MQDLQQTRALVTGGTRGLGLGIVEALAMRGAAVTTVARGSARSAAAENVGAAVRAGNAADATLMNAVVAELKPTVLILNAGATPVMAGLDEQTWESFSTVWDTDVKAGFYGIQAALKTPLPTGSRVLIASSGAATLGAPLSGSYAGAKRMLWFMAEYANAIATERGLDITFQVLVPMQMMGNTDLILEVAGAYARRAGISVETFMSNRYGKAPMSAREYGEYVARLLTDARYASGVAYGIDSANGITSLDGA